VLANLKFVEPIVAVRPSPCLKNNNDIYSFQVNGVDKNRRLSSAISLLTSRVPSAAALLTGIELGATKYLQKEEIHDEHKVKVPKPNVETSNVHLQFKVTAIHRHKNLGSFKNVGDSVNVRGRL
jgi:hypothetical protein